MADVPHKSPHVVSAETDGDTATFELKDDIDLHSSPDLRTDLLGALANPEIKTLVLDLADVPYVDSSAIAVMVEALQRLRKAGGRVVLKNLSPRVKGLLEIARLESIFTVEGGGSAADPAADRGGSS